jgi:hypothetical protein
MAYMQGGNRGGYFAPTMRRQMGWWTLLPLWALFLRTFLALGVSIWIASSAQTYFASPNSPVDLSHVSLQESLFDLALLVEGGVDALVKGIGQEAAYLDLKAGRGLDGEANALQATLYGIENSLRHPIQDPARVAQNLERWTNEVAADVESVAAVVGSGVERGDFVLRKAGQDAVDDVLRPAYLDVERWLVARRMW